MEFGSFVLREEEEGYQPTQLGPDPLDRALLKPASDRPVSIALQGWTRVRIPFERRTGTARSSEPQFR
jgi:hypothetical protein